MVITQSGPFDELIDILIEGYFEVVYREYLKQDKISLKNNDLYVRKSNGKVVSETFRGF